MLSVILIAAGMIEVVFLRRDLTPPLIGQETRVYEKARYQIGSQTRRDGKKCPGIPCCVKYHNLRKIFAALRNSQRKLNRRLASWLLIPPINVRT